MMYIVVLCCKNAKSSSQLMLFNAIVEELYIMNPNLSGWRGEQCLFSSLTAWAVGHSGGPGLKGPIPPSRGQKLEQKVCLVRLRLTVRFGT